MAKQAINQELSKLSASTPIELFELDTREIDGNNLPEDQQVLRFHNFVSETYMSIYFGSVKYAPLPIAFKNNELKGDGSSLPRPRLAVGNADGAVSYYIRLAQGLIGAKLTRKRTFARFLSGETWGLSAGQNPFGTPDSEASLASDIYYIDKIISEGKDVVEFELSSILELNKIKLPRRRMFANNCSFEYRNSTGCDYTGEPAADASDKKFTSASGYNFTLTNRGEWDPSETYNQGDYVYVVSPFLKEDGSDYKKFYFVALQNGVTGADERPQSSSKWKMDMCSRKINGCLCRFAEISLPFGGFPALVRVEIEG